MTMLRRSRPITDAELTAARGRGPSDRVAFLSAGSNARLLAETLSAMANAHGGLVLLGVTKRGAAQRDLDLDQLRDRVVEAGLMTDPPLILPVALVVAIGAREAVAVQVPPGLPHIYSLQGLYLTRAGANNRPLTTPELRRLLLERGEAGFEEQVLQEATLDDLDQRRIFDYLEQIDLAPNEASLQALLARGCIGYRESSVLGDAGRRLDQAAMAPTVAGMLLFGHEPQRFVRCAELICVRYATPTMSDEFVRQELSGTLSEQIKLAESFVVGNMRRGMKIAGMLREETTEYPLPVVREAIVNAIAHRDYSVRGEGIRLLMFSDRLEVYSPGRLPGHVTLENLKDERYSRNDIVVAVLSDLGYIERLGYGVDRMIATMEQAGLPAPRFEEMSAGFRVTLESASDTLVSDRPEQQRWGHGFLNDRQERAMAFVQEHERITNSDYQNLAPDVSAETIRRDLADLVEKNLLLRIGTKRATYYIIK